MKIDRKTPKIAFILKGNTRKINGIRIFEVILPRSKMIP